MNSHDFENELKRQPLRDIPPEWKREILRAASPGEPRGSWLLALRDVVWPSPAGWGALATVWLVIAGLKMATADPRDTKPVDYAQLHLAMQLKRDLGAEADAARPESDAAKPRSDARRRSASV